MRKGRLVTISAVVSVAIVGAAVFALAALLEGCASSRALGQALEWLAAARGAP